MKTKMLDIMFGEKIELLESVWSADSIQAAFTEYEQLKVLATLGETTFKLFHGEDQIVKEREYIKYENGKTQAFVLKVAGKNFRCPCGCNVFSKFMNDGLEIYECNSCSETYTED